MAMNLRQNQEPLYIKVNETDNTAIIVNDGDCQRALFFHAGSYLKRMSLKAIRWR